MAKAKLSKNFKLLLSHITFSSFAASVMLVLFPWIVLTITNSALYTGLMLSLDGMPYIFSFIVSYYITRLKKKKLLVLGGSFFRVIIIFFLFVIFLSGNKLLELISIFVAFFIDAWLGDLTGEVHSFWNKEFLNEDQYQRASSIGTTLNMVIILISYIMAGIIIYIGIYNGFLVILLGYIIATVPIIFIKPKSDESSNNIKLHSFKDGISFLWDTKALRYTAIFSMLTALTFGGFLMIIEVLVKFSYNGSPFVLTLLLVLGMLGGVLGSVLGGKIKGNPRTLLFVAALSHIPLIIFIPFSPSYIFLIPDLFLLMVLNQVENVLLNTINYKVTPQDYVLQVRGAENTLGLFPSVLSALILGAIIQFISLKFAFYTMAILSVSVVIIVFIARDLGNIKISE